MTVIRVRREGPETCKICGKPARGEAFMLGFGLAPVCADCKGKGTVVVAPGDPLGRETKQVYAMHFKNLALAYERREGFGNNLDVPKEVAQARADGLRQAADILIDGIPEEAVQARQTTPEPAKLGRAGRARQVAKEIAKALPPTLAPYAHAMRPVASNGSSAPSETAVGEGPSLSTGEMRILAAVAQGPKGRSNDELTAIVDYRMTSLRTYLSNLRLAGYIETFKERHMATSTGLARAADAPRMPVGAALLKVTFDRVSKGEEVILRAIIDGTNTQAALIGGATGLKMTSVRTYVSLLVQRKVLVRVPGGELQLAPIVRKGAK